MQSLFDVVPESLFSLLAAQNKEIYFRLLMVLRECYQGELRFCRSDLVSLLIYRMESDLLSLASAVDEPAADESQADGGTGRESGRESDEPSLSGRAHMLVRRLFETGWLTAVPDESSLEELLLVPDYAVALLDVLHSIVNPAQKPYNSYVFSTYSALRTAHEERDYMFPALQSAYDNTQALADSLRSLLHNIHHFYQSLQSRSEIRDLLTEHYDEYQTQIAARTYHPLKTVDSVHRFRPRILGILRDWLQDPDVMELLVQSMQTHRSGQQSGEARYEIIRMVQYIIDSLEGMDSYLREIDRRNSAYSRASAERMQYLLNTDRGVKGKLVEILKAAPPFGEQYDSQLAVEMAQLPIFRVAFVDPEMLYTDPIRKARADRQPLVLSNGVTTEEFTAQAEELLERVNALYSRERIIEFILKQMPESGELPAECLRLDDVNDFLRTMIAVITAEEQGIPYELAWQAEDGTVSVGPYSLPAMTFRRKGDDGGLATGV
ncbi:MAG: Wadjet anti-phage system protein JetA family protein [Bacilli bacterium]